MPTYDYKCDACGVQFERFQSIMADPIRKCPECGKLKLRRLIGTGAGLIFKGSGFYITDYRSDSYKNAAKSDGGAKTDAGKTDSTPATSTGTPSANGSPKTTSSDTKPAARSDAPAPKSPPNQTPKSSARSTPK